MAKVKVLIAGGDTKDAEASDIGDVRSLLNIESNAMASVNGEPADDEYQLRNNDFVTFSKPVKAG